jgi:hypothetical protein
LVERHLLRAEITRWCKKKTMFRLRGDQEGRWRRIESPHDARVDARLVDKFGDKIECVANRDVDAAVELSLRLLRERFRAEGQVK